MKRKIIVGLIIVGMFFSSPILVFLSEVKAEQEVIFPDKILESVIREKIGKSTGPIYESDLSEITYLRIIGINDLRGLEYCKNLTKIEFYNTEISDITPLSNLTNLEELRIDSNNISDVTPPILPILDCWILVLSTYLNQATYLISLHSLILLILSNYILSMTTSPISPLSPILPILKHCLFIRTISQISLFFLILLILNR